MTAFQRTPSPTRTRRRRGLRGLFLAGAIALGLGLGGGLTPMPGLMPPPAGAADPLKVGFLYVGPVGDYGWSHQHDQGRQAIETAFGDAVETAYVESVEDGADAERVVRQFAANGFDLIFATSFGFMNPTIKVAKQFPQVRFEHCTGYKRTDNVATYMGRFYEGRYVLGVIAGLMTKTNTIGFVGSFPIPEAVRGVNAFARGIQSVNPDARVKVLWVNSWYAPGKEREAAETLVAQGADILSQITDSPAPIQVAEEKGIHAFGQASDMSRFGPRAHLVSLVDNWRDYYVDRTKAVMDGTWTATDTWGGLATGMVALTDYAASLPADVVAKAEAARAAIAGGSLHPFAGPIQDQSGSERVAAGETLSDPALLAMDWFVAGVEGDLPR